MTESTAVAARPEPKAQLVAGATVAALIPHTMEEAFRVANAIAIAGLAPKGLEKPEQILVAIMAGAELGFAPFQALQSFAVVNGKPTLWGDGLLAVVLRNGFGVREWTENEADNYPDNMTAFCEVTRPDNGDVKEAKFSVADAKKAGLWGKQGPWQTNPKRMLKMRARAFACRDGAADALKGFQMREELEDYQDVRDVTPAKSGVMARLQAHGGGAEHGFSEARVEEGVSTEQPKPVEEIDAVVETAREADTAEVIDQETGEITGAEVEPQSEPQEAGGSNAVGTEADDFPGDRPAGFTLTAEPDPEDWAVAFNGKLDACKSEAEIDALLKEPAEVAGFHALEAAKPSMARALNAAVVGRRKALKSMTGAS